MLNLDEDALICDLAETYGIYNYKGLSLKQVATLSCGLRDNSRIKMRLSDMKISTETLLVAACLDKLSFIAWSKTEEAQRNQNRPSSVVNALLYPKEQENETYLTADEFEAVRKQILENM